MYGKCMVLFGGGGGGGKYDLSPMIDCMEDKN